jgi:cellulose synthase/poly-beta-1,6-N-acetylglucosamine synthase-like glycosyltransferase
MSAAKLFSRKQLVALAVFGVCLLASLLLWPMATIVALNAVVTGFYVITLAFNTAWFNKMLGPATVVTVPDDEASSLPDADLPTYTVLVPAYGEGNVIGETVRRLQDLEYPAKKLELTLLLEADDVETIAAAERACAESSVQIVRVPNIPPRTKPKACNYGWRLSSGSLLTIFDAEDRPDPLQLRRAVVAFRRLGSSVACLQARLQYHNAEQNLITRWFAAEYLAWFSCMLPALVAMRAPVPLGGTSMHVRTEALEAVGGWDPHNVTEDADLGVRLHRFGFRTALLDSTTYEEANSDFINWVKQRSRWYKGYLQTWLVHMRQPRRTWAELGPAGFLGFSVVMAGTPALALLNPVFWLLTGFWFFTRNELAIFPAWIFYPGILCMLMGNFLVFYRTLVAVRAAGQPALVFAALLYPAYWLMMSIAAVRALCQLVVAPSFWDKTVHGLDQQPNQVEASVR